MILELDLLTTAVWIYDVDRYRIVWANKSGLDFWQCDTVSSLSSHDFYQETPDTVKANLKAYRDILIKGGKLTFDWLFVPKGVKKYTCCQLSSYILKDGRSGILVEALPIECTQTQSDTMHKALLSTFHYHGQFISANPSFYKDLGDRVDNLSDLVSDAGILREIYASLANAGYYEGEVLVDSVHGRRWFRLISTEITDKSGRHHILVHQYDIHHRKTKELTTVKQAHSDPLTGLMNRKGLYAVLNTITTKNEEFHVFCVDLDGFKYINDSAGHAVGDQLLRLVAKRLANFNCGKNISCRFGGDNFILVISEKLSCQQRKQMAEKIISEISGTYYDHSDSPFTLSCSVGIASYPFDTESISDLITFSDVAMRQSKYLGKHRSTEYHQDMEHVIRRQGSIAQRLYSAEQNNELELHYQPIWDMRNQKIVSFEALLRWTNPDIGLVPAEETMQVAEAVGIAYGLENWVIERALSDLVILRRFVGSSITMSINISGLRFAEPGLADYIVSVLRKNKLLPSDIIIELTESALLENLSGSNNPSRQFIEKGLKISIDDFGTGFSSLAYLHEIPATMVKIDRSFVHRIESNGETLLHISSLIRSLNMQTLAEGVETEKQREILESFDIHLHQGFLHGRPHTLSHYIKSQQELLLA